MGVVRLHDEYVVLLDEGGTPAGRQLKATVHHEHTPLHLAFSIFLFDGAGQALFQQRAESKLAWPGVWSNACCGHPSPGEPLVDAAHRRLREELGIETHIPLELVLPEFRYRARWADIWENELCPVFVGHYDGPVRPNPREVAAVQWIAWSDFAGAVIGDGAMSLEAFSPWSRWEAALLLGHRTALAHRGDLTSQRG